MVAWESVVVGPYSAEKERVKRNKETGSGDRCLGTRRLVLKLGQRSRVKSEDSIGVH